MKRDIQRLVGQKIREMRKKKGLTQEELAAQTGIDYKYIQRIEGRTPPNITIVTVNKLAEALQTKPSKFFD